MPPRRPPPRDDLFAQPPERPAPTNRPAYSVSELATELRRLTETAIGQVWIKGEITDRKVYDSGHWYFTLRDADAQLRCVMWRTYTQKIRNPPPEGAEIYLLGTPTVFSQRGELRINAVAILPTAGVGAQQLLLEQTRERLARDGLFDPARKRALPAYPRALAVVTSPDGAVVHDIITVARSRWPAIRILMVPARVQGEDAPDELVAALGIVNRLDQIDLCILARGGGARDDLSAFNTEPVCRALAAVAVPTISAVGHETDVTLADLVADLRAATPSAAAAIALPDRAELARRLSGLGRRLGGGLTRRTRVMRERLGRVDDRLRSRLAGLTQARRRTLDRLAATLDALSPLAVLGRGYAVARTDEGTVVRRRAQLPDGTPFRLRVSDGDVRARSEEP